MPGPRSKKNNGATLRRSPGRPRSGEVRGEVAKVTTTIPGPLFTAIDNEAAACGLSRAALLCELLAEALEARWSK